MKTDITVLMPVYNGGKYLKEAIDSILNQTYTDFEFLIINDGSTDNSIEIINAYADNRIRLINQKNGGVSDALNTGLKHAVGEYIVRFDADDVCYPTRIEEQYNFMMKYPEYILVGSDADYITKDGEYIFTFNNKGYTDEQIRESSVYSCPFIHSTVMYKKQVVLDLGGYEVKAHTFEDYFLWTKLLKVGKVYNFNKPMIKVRFNPESVTVDSKDYNKTFRQLHQKALLTGVITDAEGELILKSIEKLDKNKKEFSYNRMLGKKYLWNNYQPLKARSHLRQAVKIKPLDLVSFILILLSYLPARFIQFIYSKFK
ncbi:MAG: glycosyltransferase [Bacteroidota bacterium]